MNLGSRFGKATHPAFLGEEEQFLLFFLCFLSVSILYRSRLLQPWPLTSPRGSELTRQVQETASLTGPAWDRMSRACV